MQYSLSLYNRLHSDWLSVWSLLDKESVDWSEEAQTLTYFCDSVVLRSRFYVFSVAASHSRLSSDQLFCHVEALNMRWDKWPQDGR